MLVGKLPDFINNKFGLTGTYIACYDHPNKKFDAEENDDVKAHVDETSPKVLTYISSSKSHEYMIGKVLPKDESISYELFDNVENDEEVNYETEIDEETKEEV